MAIVTMKGGRASGEVNTPETGCEKRLAERDKRCTVVRKDIRLLRDKVRSIDCQSARILTLRVRSIRVCCLQGSPSHTPRASSLERQPKQGVWKKDGKKTLPMHAR